MEKEYEEVTLQELKDGLEKLDKQGELKSSKEDILNEVVLNTTRSYAGHNQVTQPFNAKLAKEQAKKQSNSKILRQNMIDAGRHFPKDTDAHHIVPSKENRIWAKDNAAAARAILKRWGIPINHEANGVALPSSSKIPVDDLPDAYPHKTVHTKVYYLNIAGQLAEANSRAECIEILREIGEELEDGTYPLR